MKIKFVLFATMLICLYSCSKDDDGIRFGKPKIIWEKELPELMTGRLNSASSPVVYGDYLISSERDTGTNKSRFYKFHKSDGTYINRWEEGTHWWLSGYLKYFYKDQLIFNNRGEKITAIDIHTMETAWEITTPYIHSYIYPLDNKVFGVQFIDGRQVFWEFNLDTKHSRVVFSTDPVETGIFSTVSKPSFFINETNDTIISVATVVDSSFILVCHNISADSLLWERELSEFNENAHKPPSSVSSVDSFLVVNSNDYLSCRDAKDGEMIWSHSITSNPISVNFDPLVTRNYIFHGGDRLVCASTISGETIWSHENRENGIYIGATNDLLYEDGTFFLDPTPFDMQTGYPYRNWDIGSGNPGVEVGAGKLYYTSRGKLVCVKNPNY
jgi:outer membrane protein assembly factor BamB